MAASKHTHAHAQCSHASVGLAQARPNEAIFVWYRPWKHTSMQIWLITAGVKKKNVNMIRSYQHQMKTFDTDCMQSSCLCFMLELIC